MPLHTMLAVLTSTLLTFAIVVHLTGAISILAAHFARSCRGKCRTKELAQQWTWLKLDHRGRAPRCLEPSSTAPCYFSLQRPSLSTCTANHVSREADPEVERDNECRLWMVLWRPQLPETPVEPTSPYPVPLSSRVKTWLAPER